MHREARRLALVQRQALIAGVARRAAMRGLAEALDEERRRAGLAARSRDLLAGAAPRPGASSGAALAARAGFARGVAQIARDALAAAGDAARQTAWQADALAAAEARVKRLREMEDAAARAFKAARARRDAAVPQPMARKLHCREQAPAKPNEG